MKLEAMSVTVRQKEDHKKAEPLIQFLGSHELWASLSLSNDKAAAAAAKSLQSCPTLCDLIDGSPSGSPVPGIRQARILEWAVISFSNA